MLLFFQEKKIIPLLNRRTLLTTSAALLLADAPLPVPTSNRLLFQVVRASHVIGTHRLDFARSGPNLQVSVNVVMDVSIGPFPIFHYQHHALESWNGNECVSVESQTDHNGRKLQVLAKRDATGWQVNGSHGNLRAPANSLPATHWNRAMLNGPMINTDTGSIMRPRIADLGQQTIPLFSGGNIAAEHFVMSGDAVMETWYDAAPSWAGAQFRGGDGSVIRYIKA